MNLKKLLGCALASFIGIHAVSALDIDVREVGAVPDGKTLNTEAIQKAIDMCSAKGGGTVIITGGEYVIGSIFLKDNVTLNITKEAALVGSTSRDNYIHQGEYTGLINALKADNIGITGEGMIFGNGQAFFETDNAPNRPMILYLQECTRVKVKDVFMKNSAFWGFKMSRCDGVIVDGIRIYNHCNWNNDGIDIESKNVVIANCILTTDDDALCFKSDVQDFIVENVTVTNCILSSNCNYIKFGTASSGGFRNITISNCTLRPNETTLPLKWGNTPRDWRKLVPGVTKEVTGISGIALEVVDGGLMDQISISNITMDGIQTPIFIRLGHRNKDDRKGVLKNVIISNIVATSESLITNNITGLEDSPVENVMLSNMIFNMKAGGTIKDANMPVPEVPDAYPENRMFNFQMLSGYGMYIRHAKGITLDNIVFNLQPGEEYRPAVYAEDVHGLRLLDMQAEPSLGNQPAIRLNDCTNALISGFSANKEIPVLLEVKGNKTDNIKLINNDLSLVKKAVDSSDKSLADKVTVK